MRRVTVTIECTHGAVFVHAPQAQGAARQPGGGARFGRSTLDDEAALENMGDVELGVAAQVPPPPRSKWTRRVPPPVRCNRASLAPARTRAPAPTPRRARG